MLIPFDQSQLSVLQTCEAKWEEKYVKKLVPVRETRGARNDAAAVGSLVHAGLEIYEKYGTIGIPEETLGEIRPTPETVQLANQLLAAYRNHADRVEWPMKIFEEPLRGPDLNELFYMMAKVDFAFRVDVPTEVRIGVDEYLGTELLQPGWYIQEYKTKDVGIPRGAWIKGWQMRPQADFQIMCLGQAMGATDELPVRGIMVTVLEYEKKRPPIRTCKACKEKLPFASFLELPDGTWQCIVCGGASKLAPAKVSEEMQPLIWKTLVTRTEDQLQGAMRNIHKWALAAAEISSGFLPARMNTSECVNRWGGECGYYPAHSNWRGAELGPDFVQIDTHRYMTQQAEGPEVVNA